MGVLAQQTVFRALFSSKAKAQRLKKGVLKCVAGAQAGGVRRPAWGRGVLVLSVDRRLGGAFRAQGQRLMKEVAAGAWWPCCGRAAQEQWVSCWTHRCSKLPSGGKMGKERSTLFRVRAW